MNVHADRPPTTPSPVHSMGDVLRPLLDLFEAASGVRVVFVVSLFPPRRGSRHAYDRDEGLVTLGSGEEPEPAVPPGILSDRIGSVSRRVAPLRRADGIAFGELAAHSRSGRAFPEPGGALLQACADLLAPHFALMPAGLADAGSPEAGAIALADPLTGLPNRHALLPELERMLARAQRDDMTVFAVCVGFGSPRPDEAPGTAPDMRMASLAMCLAGSVRSGDLVARTGRGTCAVVGTIPRSTAEASVAVVLQRLSAQCAQRLPHARAEIGIGFAIARIGEFDPVALLAEAEAGIPARPGVTA